MNIQLDILFFIIRIQVHIHGKSWLYISLNEMENTETNGNEKMNKKVQKSTKSNVQFAALNWGKCVVTTGI